MALLLSLQLLLVCAALAFSVAALLRPPWVTALLRRVMGRGAPLLAVPEGDLETLDASLFAELVCALEKRLEGIDEHLNAIRGLAEERGRELERYREGYNLAVTRSFARGVIKAVDLVSDYERQLATAYQADGSALLEDARTRLAAVGDQLVLLLESNQVEQYSPEPGTALQDDARKLNPIETSPAPTPRDVGRVKHVRYPGYILRIAENEDRVIREAQVEVFASEGKGSNSA